MWNSCTSIFPNIRVWEQQELNKTKKYEEEDKKRDRREINKKSRRPKLS